VAPASRDDVQPEAIGADDDDQLVASLSLADRIRYRVENNTKGGEKGPGKFRKWATKLRKRPDGRREAPVEGAGGVDPVGRRRQRRRRRHAPPRSAPLAIHSEPLGTAGGGGGGGGESPPVDQFDNALSDVDDDSSGAYRRAVGGGAGGGGGGAGSSLLSSAGNDDNDGNDADADGVGAVAALTRVGKADAGVAKRASKSLLTT
jgi:hypothetical protein